MKKGLLFCIPIVTLLTLISCGDSSFFSATEVGTHSVTVKNPSQGGMLDKSQALIFTVHSPESDEAPAQLDINLYTPEGDKVAAQTIMRPGSDEDLALDFPDLEPGQFEIEFILYGQDAILAETRQTFFLVEGIYEIVGIESFTPVIFPESTVLLKAELSVPEGADPYIRWKQNNESIYTGSLSEGMDEIFWSAPIDEGVYSLSVELFPAAPSGERDFGFTSSVLMNTELYVSSERSNSEKDLGPRESYYSLYNLNDHLIDVGAGIGKSGGNDSEVFGEILPVSSQGILGYRLSGESGFRIPRFIFPSVYGDLSPFTLSLGLRPNELNEGIQIVHASAGDGAFSLTIFLNDNLSPTVLIETGSEQILVPSEIEWDIGVRYLLSLSILPVPDRPGIVVTWLLDGAAVSTSTHTMSLTGLEGAGETIIGAEESGFVGVLDEIGVFYKNAEGKPSIDSEIFTTGMQQKFGQRLIFAEGFDGQNLPDDLLVIGEAELESGFLKLPPSGEIILPVYLPESETALISALLPYQEHLTFQWEASSLDITAVNPGSEGTARSAAIIIQLTRKEASVELEEKDLVIANPVEDMRNVRVRFFNEKDLPLLIDSILIHFE